MSSALNALTPQVFGSTNSARARRAVYIGRPSLWGNPFTVEEHGHGRAIELYREWIYAPEQEELRARMKRVLRGSDLRCYCAPAPCHGDIILEIANS